MTAAPFAVGFAAAANPDAVVSLYDSAGHSLDEPAKADRSEFVRTALDL